MSSPRFLPAGAIVAIVGNPNSGKTTLFNALTGLRQKVANYPGVTIEKKEGRLTLPTGRAVTLLDLPGAYSLTPNSPDETIAINVLLGQQTGTPAPSFVVCVVDASNLERNLYLVSQLLDLHLPLIVALNMVDVAEREGYNINFDVLEQELGVPIVPVVATKGRGLNVLLQKMSGPLQVSSQRQKWKADPVLADEHAELETMLQSEQGLSPSVAYHEALVLLSSEDAITQNGRRFTTTIIEHVQQDHRRLRSLGIDPMASMIEARYAWIHSVCTAAVSFSPAVRRSLTDRLDSVLAHKVWGLAIFFAVMAFMFQTVFAWAELPMNWIANGIDAMGKGITVLMPPGDLRGLVVGGALGGVGAVIAFLPQIIFLFLFLGVLEDSGYMARAAFLMDKLMSRVGLHGKSFIPLLGSFACAIPGIMATRTIENRKDRLVTMLVAPLMSCSARLPVYALMIAAFIPQKKIFRVFSLPALTLAAMYFLGLIVALAAAWVFKKTLLKSETPAFIMELPPYRTPSIRSLLLHTSERAWAFVKRAGTFILGVSIILWFLATYPKLDGATPSERLEKSFAGRAGKLIEPVIRPLGFDWKIGIGLVGSLLQREVFVSTMGTIYNIADANQAEAVSLREKLRADVNPITGQPVFTMLTALCLMVYYVLAMQCLSTVAVVRRESNSWKWPAFMISYMTVLAYAGTFLTYRIGLLLGL
ncbi:MAG: ferrous iron transport protein B [Ignavibacteriales bacterium]|nr:ferrous iron transport protein B [Ignavibacteriales bacterium]